MGGGGNGRMEEWEDGGMGEGGMGEGGMGEGGMDEPLLADSTVDTDPTVLSGGDGH